jgi:membrane protein required for colicin V production
MGLTALDILVLIAVGGAAILGATRGFVTEVLSLMAWLFVVLALKIFLDPLAATLAPSVGTSAGAATLAFAVVGGVTFFGGRMVARAIGNRTKSSVLGPLDRGLGFGFGAVKGLVLASLGFLLVTLVIDTVSGGPQRRPQWMTQSRTYPLLNATSAGIADFVDRRRKGEPVWGGSGNEAAPAGNLTER